MPGLSRCFRGVVLGLKAMGLALLGGAIGIGANALSPRPVALSRPIYPASASGAATCAEPAHGSEPAHGLTRAPVRTVAAAEAMRACADCSAAFVDARAAADFERGHVPGAIHLPPRGHAGEAVTLAGLRAFSTVIVYDDGGACALAGGVLDRLAAAGFKDVRLLDGSWRGWEAAGGAGQSGACHACLSEGRAP
jgi:3-mercaptopyruvate sulfurtransferase SseA